jgi:hypothetical protein
MTDDTPLTEAELTRMADGSLPESARASLHARVAHSPALGERLREQERAVSLMRSTDELGAPASLRAAVTELAATDARAGRRARRTVDPSRWGPRMFVPLATAVAVVVVSLVLVLTGGSNAPTVEQTTRLALAAAVTPAPPEARGNRDLLTVRGAGIPFPSYASSVRWRATGARRDTLSGRQVTTVFYRDPHGARVGYAIVAGPALAQPAGRAFTAGGIRYVLGATGSAKLISWRRNGHTCVIAGRGVSVRMLVALVAADEQTT